VSQANAADPWQPGTLGQAQGQAQGQAPPPGGSAAPGQAAPLDPPGQPAQPAQPGWPAGPVSEQFQRDYAPSAAYPPGAIAPRRTNSLAIAALCCGIGQFVFGPLTGIPAVILGAISLRQIRDTGEDGRGMAITGVVLGAVGTVLLILAIMFIAVIVHTASAHA
jgi:Domain of unknown function (DUF4190)